MSLTDTAIKRLQPSDKCKPNQPDKISDGNGLWLFVRHTGTKVFLSVYRHQGKQKEITLGKYPALTLAQARLKNQKIKSLLEQGIDPKEHAKEAKIQKNDTRFDVFAHQWLANQQQRIKASTFKRDKAGYQNHIYPMIGEKDIYQIRLADIIAIHDRLAVIGKTSTAHRIVTWINAIYDYAIEKGLAENLANPIPKSIHKNLVEHKATHYPRIPISQLPRLLADIDNCNSEPLTKYGFYVLCYTFVRTSELRGMRWQEIDFETCLWHIPKERMKNGLPHVVPLAPQVIRILKEIQKMQLHNEYVFFSNRSRRADILSNNAFTVALKRMGYQGRMTGHGFRGLASTALYEMQYSPQAIELQLSHVQGNKTVRAYNEANLLPARQKMMNQWADIVDEIKQGNFSTYKNKRLTDHNEQAFISFLKAMRYKEHEITDELAIHKVEVMELKALQ